MGEGDLRGGGQDPTVLRGRREASQVPVVAARGWAESDTWGRGEDCTGP